MFSSGIVDKREGVHVLEVVIDEMMKYQELYDGVVIVVVIDRTKKYFTSIDIFFQHRSHSSKK